MELHTPMLWQTRHNLSEILCLCSMCDKMVVFALHVTRDGGAVFVTLLQAIYIPDDSGIKIE